MAKKKSAYKTPFSYARLLSAQDHRCFYCAQKITDHSDREVAKALGVIPHTRDHFFSASSGHKNIWGNVVMACPGCNRDKGCRVPTRAECVRFYTLWRRAGFLHWISMRSAWDDFMAAQLVIAAFTYLFGETYLPGQLSSDVDFNV